MNIVVKTWITFFWLTNMQTQQRAWPTPHKTKYWCLEHLALESVSDSRFCVFRKGTIIQPARSDLCLKFVNILEIISSYWLASNIFKFWPPVGPNFSWLYAWYISQTKCQCLEYLVLDSVLDSRFCVFRKGSIMFSVAHSKKLCFSSVRVGNDSNEITTECVRYITQVCLTKQNVERIIFMPILYVSYL